jgi:hypothetical protein
MRPSLLALMHQAKLRKAGLYCVGVEVDVYDQVILMNRDCMLMQQWILLRRRILQLSGFAQNPTFFVVTFRRQGRPGPGGPLNPASRCTVNNLQLEELVMSADRFRRAELN